MTNSDDFYRNLNLQSEDVTRRVQIDEALKDQKWDVADKSQVLVEIDTKNSDFKKGIYKTRDDTLKTEKEKAYLDYLLLDGFGKPLAVIEAKRPSTDPIIAKRQAEEYVKDIAMQTGGSLFLYLTNGLETWFWNYPYETIRRVSSFHRREDLERIRFQNENRKNKLTKVAIREDIINRPYQIEAVTRTLETLDKGRRKALLVMATGTGKTRVTMAIINSLLESNRYQKILFLADRQLLRDQAFDKGFKKYFPNEAKTKIYTGSFDDKARLFVSTIQTLNECYEELSPGFFDVIISDEAHRSIYGKWKDIFEHFDAVQIGLTATPAKYIERDTFRFFDCENSAPTFNYTFEEAVADKYLVDFRVYKAKTRFQIKGIQLEDLPSEVKTKLYEEGYEQDELSFDGTDLEKKVTNKGTNEALVKEFMENCITDELGKPAKTIIFAVSQNHAKRLREAFDRLYPEYASKLAEVVVSSDPRAVQVKESFEKEDMPRIALSVDMLDTGVDVEAVQNLVFAKPVFSEIKFWQMIGRGTRLFPRKDYFLIFDHWDNFEFFKMNPKGKIASEAESLPVKIFRLRLEQAKILKENKQTEQFDKIKQLLIADIESLPKKNVQVKQHLNAIDKALEPVIWDSPGIDPYDFLRKNIAPLMRFKTNVNYNTASFTLKTEQLALAKLASNEKEWDRVKKSLSESLLLIPNNLIKSKTKLELKRRAEGNTYWKDAEYKDLRQLQDELTELMQFARSEPVKQIELDLDDAVNLRDWDEHPFEYGPEGQTEHVKEYRAKAEERIKELAQMHPTVKKIQNEQTLTDADIKKLEETLNSPDLYITEETLQKLYRKHNGSLVQFIKKVLGMYDFPDPKKEIETAFDDYLKQNKHLTPTQVRFVKTLKSVFASNKHIDYKDFYEAPFTNLGNQVPTPLFTDKQLGELVALCYNIEKKVFPNASA